MIGKLQGRLEYRSTDHVMLMVGGVGYVVYCNERTLASMPNVGEAAALYTDLLVREDLLQLFGFTTLAEKEWHRLLMSVQGVGAKAAMAIMGTLGEAGLSRAIAMGDWNSVKAAKGIGPKTAQKVVIDLKDKAPAIMAMGGSVHDALGQTTAVADDVIDDGDDTGAQNAPQVASMSTQSEALSALGNLGYAPQDAASAVAQASDQGAQDTSALIKAALKLLAPKG
jgi:holliday junction DNA helicase RuvA